MENSAHLIKDLIEGEESITEREDFLSLSPNEISRALQIITSNKHFSDETKKYLIANTWKVNYKVKPPTMAEFLTEEWLGETAKDIFPYLKEALINLFDPNQSYRNLIFYYPIGSGKSYATCFLNLYIASIIYLMRNPRKTLGLGASSIICNTFMAASLDKAKEILLKPFKEIMIVSPKFVKCRTVDQMLEREKEYGTSKICWTTAGGDASAITFGSNMSFKIKSSISSLLGLTILCGSVTELTFFKEVGYSDEDIKRLYNDLKGRIFSRFPDAFWAKSVLDSSPNDASYEASLDWSILNVYPNQLDPKTKKPINIVLSGKKWELQPDNFPEWSKDKSKIFYMFMGGKDGKPPKVLSENSEASHYNDLDILECPLDCLNLAQDDPVKFLKDYAGIPAGVANRLINDNTKIENIFKCDLHNLYSHITALETEQPEHLIWNKIQDEFFMQLGSGTFEFYRNPLEQRFVSVDLSVSGDTAAVCVSHPELTIDGEVIDILDMTICIIPNKARINLDAVACFIKDLRYLGKMNIQHVSFDQFQSESAQQFLRRNDFDVEHLSVDDNTAPYLNFIQQINLGRVKCGKNIYLKNNLKSIKMSKTKGGKPKVDHENGKITNGLHDNDEWKTSALGFNSKDISDAVVASIELRRKYFTGVPSYIYEEIQDEKAIVAKLPKNMAKIGFILK